MRIDFRYSMQLAIGLLTMQTGICVANADNIALRCKGQLPKGEFDASIFINGPFRSFGSGERGEGSIFDNVKKKWIDVRGDADLYKSRIEIINSAGLFEPYGSNGEFPYQLQLDRQSGDYHWISESSESRGECEKTSFSDPPAKQKKAPTLPPANKF